MGTMLNIFTLHDALQVFLLELQQHNKGSEKFWNKSIYICCLLLQITVS